MPPATCSKAIWWPPLDWADNRNGSTSEHPAARRRWTTNTRTSPRAIDMVEEGIERLSDDPTQEHDRLHEHRTEGPSDSAPQRHGCQGGLTLHPLGSPLARAGAFAVACPRPSIGGKGRPMRRGPKPAKSKESKPSVARKL